MLATRRYRDSRLSRHAIFMNMLTATMPRFTLPRCAARVTPPCCHFADRLPAFIAATFMPTAHLPPHYVDELKLPLPDSYAVTCCRFCQLPPISPLAADGPLPMPGDAAAMLMLRDGACHTPALV